MKAFISVSILLLVAIAACDRRAPETSSSSGGDSTGERATTTAPAPTTARASDSASATGSAASPGTTEDPDEEESHKQLYGTWEANDVDTSMGEVKIRLTFRKRGSVRILAWSDLPFVGQVRNKQAPYEIHGNTLTSDAIRGGTSVNYRFKNGDLLIEYKDGKTVRFTRVNPAK